jgi:hypothetical protein
MRGMKKIILALFISGNLFSQNWNVFNKNYRYNYKYNFSQLVTNVMFAETVQQSGTDTIYALNRIGVECTGSCPTLPSPPSPTVTYVVPNMPQFLQRNIRKYQDGRVELFDTTDMIIVPSCTLNQNWLFDNLHNKTAICTDISTVTVFGITDSVKTILVDNTDSVQLSKSFGLLLFPNPYGKNKYYRLVGIENKNSYDKYALYGEKVPNAWDFYNYQVGDTICSISYHWDDNGGTYPPYSEACDFKKTIIKSKQVGLSSYSYSTDNIVRHNLSSCVTPTPGFPMGIFSYSVFSQNLTISSLTNPVQYSEQWESNIMYPGMLYTVGAYVGSTPNFIKFGVDNDGNFYKYCGPISIQYFPYPNFTGVNSYTLNNNGIYQPNNSGEQRRVAYVTGFGRVVSDYFVFEHVGYSYITAFSKRGTYYFGTSCPSTPSPSTGIISNSPDNVQPFFYPNPASSSITIPVIEKSRVEICNALGQTVLTSETEGDQKIDVSSLPNGIYFITLKNSGRSIPQKLVVSH